MRLRKVHVSGDFLGVFDFLRIACSLGIPQDNPLNLIKFRFLQTPLVKPPVFTMHLVCTLLIKHPKNFSIKAFGPFKTPPPEILYVWVFLVFLKEKGAPNIKNLQASGAPLTRPKFYVWAAFPLLKWGKRLLVPDARPDIRPETFLFGLLFRS